MCCTRVRRGTPGKGPYPASPGPSALLPELGERPLLLQHFCCARVLSLHPLHRLGAMNVLEPRVFVRLLNRRGLRSYLLCARACNQQGCQGSCKTHLQCASSNASPRPSQVHTYLNLEFQFPVGEV